MIQSSGSLFDWANSYSQEIESHLSICAADQRSLVFSKQYRLISEMPILDAWEIVSRGVGLPLGYYKSIVTLSWFDVTNHSPEDEDVLHSFIKGEEDVYASLIFPSIFDRDSKSFSTPGLRVAYLYERVRAHGFSGKIIQITEQVSLVIGTIGAFRNELGIRIAEFNS